MADWESKSGNELSTDRLSSSSRISLLVAFGLTFVVMSNFIRGFLFSTNFGFGSSPSGTWKGIWYLELLFGVYEMTFPPTTYPLPNF